MKKVFVVFTFVSVFAACGGGDAGKSASEQKTESTADDMSSNPVYQKGLELIAKNDCLTCHKIEEKLVGPSYRDVAKKYTGQDTAIQYLVHKIINGGQGVWGEIPMAAHPQLSEDDAKALAEYVLLFNK